MVRVLAVIACVAVGIAATVKPGIVVWAAGVGNNGPCPRIFLALSFCR
jgi:hypothetical protein